MPPDRVYPALDGLRAVALGAVLISHYFPERSAIQRAFHWGRFGVLLFFVLSCDTLIQYKIRLVFSRLGRGNEGEAH
mgnify:CR=1 FL=1